MSFLTKYGTIFGALPQGAGRVFWVAPAASYTVDGRSYIASDDQDGLSPERALLTLDAAINKCTANAGDVIALLPGAHSWAASAALDVAGVTIVGLPYYPGYNNFVRPKTSITTTATADQIINVTAANCTIANLRVIPITQAAGIDFSDAADNLHVVDCSFDLATPAAHTSTLGLDATAGASNVLVERCYFESDGSQGAGLDVTGCLDGLVQDSVFIASAGTWAAAVTVGAATDRMLVQRCSFYATGTAAITAGVDGTGATIATGVIVQDCRFGDQVTVAIDGFDAGEAEIAENYQAGVGATDGGVLITAIT